MAEWLKAHAWKAQCFSGEGIIALFRVWGSQRRCWVCGRIGVLLVGQRVPSEESVEGIDSALHTVADVAPSLEVEHDDRRLADCREDEVPLVDDGVEYFHL